MHFCFESELLTPRSWSLVFLAMRSKMPLSVSPIASQRPAPVDHDKHNGKRHSKFVVVTRNEKRSCQQDTHAHHNLTPVSISSRWNRLEREQNALVWLTGGAVGVTEGSRDGLVAKVSLLSLRNISWSDISVQSAN